MCGIAGIWIKKQYRNTQELSAMCRRMADSIVHRGPDDEGVWCDAEAGLFFSHRRLSILDLSPAGHQPMTSHDGRYVIVYNGEIYNHHNIRAELDSISPNIWRGTSDTETMLEAIAVWGIEKALERFNGMFAFALWDRLKRELTLARDRFGEKPLYYGWLGDCFTFASELKAIRIAGMALECPSSVFELDPEALGLFVRYQYVPTPWSIYKGIRKPPRTYHKNFLWRTSECYIDTVLEFVRRSATRH
jgi:asparagine synthase (glutamine-hydrolysing)